MRDGLIVFRVLLVVSIKQIELHASHIHAPNTGIHMVIIVGHIYHKRITFFVKLTLDGQAAKVLCLVVGYLLSVHRKALSEVAKSVEESDSAHVDIGVGGFLHIVACQHAETAAVYLQGRVNAIFHTEICH